MSFISKLKSFIPWVGKDVTTGDFDRAKQKVENEVKETELEIKEKMIKEITAEIMEIIEPQIEKRVREKVNNI